MDGPAIEWHDGTEEWYQNNKRHRENSPAIKFTDGYQAWYIHGKLCKQIIPKSTRLISI